MISFKGSRFIFRFPTEVKTFVKVSFTVWVSILAQKSSIPFEIGGLSNINLEKVN